MCVCMCVCVGCVCVSVCMCPMQEVVLDASETSYSATDLSSSTEYAVRLQAVAGAKRSRHVTTVFTTGVCSLHR